MQSEIQLQFLELLTANRKAIFKIITSSPIHSHYYNDIYQGVCMRAWASYSNFKGEASFTTWICAIAKYTAIDKLRQLKKYNDSLS